MSTYPLAELLRRWDRGELSAEQAMGHLFQHLELLEKRVAEVEKECGLRGRQVEPRPRSSTKFDRG